MAPGGSGDEPVKRAVSRRGLHIGLYVLALLLGCAVVFGGVLVHQEREDRQRASAEQERYGDVLAAARKEIEAFVNIDYTQAQDSIDAVAAGATGDFAKQYDTSTKDVVKILTKAKSVMKGEVLWAGIADTDHDAARSMVPPPAPAATPPTGNRAVPRQFRI